MMNKFINRLKRNERGAVIIEVALLLPTIILTMIGVFHVAIYMQNQNALRSLAADSARRVMVEYQKGNELSEVEIRAVVRSLAVAAPYLLDTDQMAITVKEESTSRVTDAKELTLRMDYTGESFLPFADIEALKLSYERPIFVVEDPDAADDEDAEEEAAEEAEA